MNAIGDKLLKAAEKTGNKAIAQSVKRAERADAQRKEAKAKARKEGKAFNPATKTSHGVSKAAVKKATGGKPVVKTKRPPNKNNGNGAKKGQEVLHTSDGGVTVLPKSDVSTNPPVPGPKATPVNGKPKDTLTDRGTSKLANKGKPKQKPKKSASQKHLDNAKAAITEARKELTKVVPAVKKQAQQSKPKKPDSAVNLPHQGKPAESTTLPHTGEPAKSVTLASLVSKQQAPQPVAKKADPKPKGEGSSTSHSDFMSQLRNTVKSSSGL